MGRNHSRDSRTTPNFVPHIHVITRREKYKSSSTLVHFLLLETIGAARSRLGESRSKTCKNQSRRAVGRDEYYIYVVLHLSPGLERCGFI